MASQLKFYKNKSGEYLAETERDGNMSKIGNEWYHKITIKNELEEVTQDEYGKAKAAKAKAPKSSGDKGVGATPPADGKGPAGSAAGKRLRSDDSRNGGKGKDDKGKDGPIGASGGASA